MSKEISDLENQAKELENTKLLFNEIFNVMDPAVAILSDGSFIANEAYNSFFPGWKEQYSAAKTGDDKKEFQMLAEYWDLMITNADEFNDAIKRLRETHEPQKSVWHFRDGKQFIQKGYWLDLKERSGELWILTDITKYYDAMRRANDANLAKSMFLSSMSHEIRNPMNAIIGLTSLARKSDDINKIKLYLEKTEEAGHRLMTIINDVVDINKIESGKLKFSENEFDFEKMLGNAVNVVSDRALAKRINIETVIKSPITRFMWADELRISQVIVNLLSNAVKFTPDFGKIKLTVSIQDKNVLKFSCADTGIGISEAEKEALFNSFETGDILRTYGRTGLGLSISKQIVDLLGGTINLESTEGKGSVFTFTIPIKWHGEINPLPETEGDEPRIDFREILGGKHLLLVEDAEVNRMIVEALLEDSGCIIDEAENGAIGVELAENNTYDIILMDVQMPIMDGMAAAREIRAKNADVPIIAMTASAFKEDAEACFAAGMNAHIAKPIEPESFIKTITEFLKKETVVGERIALQR
jgi:signal transduction histidine kinase/ActR/RegA family two-component response regulator